jgi:DNA-binding GntR family transcriptional regulator
VRIALETVALERFIDRMAAGDLTHLNEIIDEMRTAALSSDLTSLSDLDLHFHEFLMEKADHDLAWRMWKVLEVGIRRCLHTRHKTYTFLDEVVGSHPTLVTAIISRNKAEARQILTDHIQESMTGLLDDWEEDEERALNA